jgi:hypothetical protein
MASARDAECGHRSRFNNGDQTPAETYKYVYVCIGGRFITFRRAAGLRNGHGRPSRGNTRTQCDGGGFMFSASLAV